MPLSFAPCLFGTLLGLASATDDTASATHKAGTHKIVTVDLSKLGDEDPVATGPFASGGLNFLGELNRLRRIARDPEVAAVQLKPDHSLDAARTLDVMRELRAIQMAGKKIVCFAETLGDGVLPFASLADLLMIPPSGAVELSAPSVEVFYLQELLAKVGFSYDVIHIGEFKTAFEEMSRSTMSEPQRLELQEILKEQYEQTVTTIAKNRDLPREKVEAGFDEILLEPKRALELGLIDAIGYRDEFDAKLAELLGGAPELDADYGDATKEKLAKLLDSPFAIFSLLKEAMDPAEESLPDGARIAIVYCTGGINSGKSSAGFGGASMGADTIVEALDRVREDEQVKAVVLRVNSPGGSALASDLIWRAVQRCREKKPVVSSMGGVAASGGYWISMGCDRIVAQPSTITGSIGVVAAVPNLSQVWEKIGVNVEVVGYGPHAEELSMLRAGIAPLLRQKIESSMHGVYDEFIAKASTGRKLDPVQLEQNARGRVWSGRQAKEIGLVDGLGGLEEAITMACFLGGKLDPEKTPVLELPKPRDLFDELQEQLSGLVTVRGQVARIARELDLEAVLGWVAPLLEPAAAATRMPRVLSVVPYALRMR